MSQLCICVFSLLVTVQRIHSKFPFTKTHIATDIYSYHTLNALPPTKYQFFCFGPTHIALLIHAMC